MVLMITYDLNKVKDYKKLYAAIGALGIAKRDSELDSVWFVSTTSTPEQASAFIKRAMDGDDRLFVCRVRSGDYAGWMHEDIWTFIRNNS